MDDLTLINLLSTINDHNLIATLQLKPNKVVFIRMNDEHNKEIFQDIKYYLNNKMPDISIVEEIIADQSLAQSISRILEQYNDKKTLINLSGGTKLMSLLAYKKALNLDLPAIYVNVNQNEIVILKDDPTRNVHQQAIQLTIHDYIKQVGGQITDDATKIFNEYKSHSFIRYIINHYDMWKVVKKLLRDHHYIVTDSESLNAHILLNEMSKVQKQYLFKFLKYLSRQKFIYNYTKKYNSVHFKFRTATSKSFIMVSGSWLEALTLQVVESFKDVKDVKAGVRFNWDESARDIENELDVIALTQFALVCISCKDTSKYDVEALNELIVYTEKLGGENAIKILVSTSKPRKETVIKRAEEMGILLVIFDGDINKFKQDMKKAMLNP